MNRPTWTQGLALLVAVSLVVAPAAFGQSTNGDIQGSVSDETGAALVGVTVTATPAGAGTPKTDVTAANGSFRMPSVPAGVYKVTFALDGFQTIEQENVRVSIGGTQRLEVEMTSTFTEELVVTSERPVVDNTTTDLGVNVGEEFFQELATGRDYTSIARLAPGAQQDACLGTACQTSFYGSTSAENSYYVDGVNTTGIELGQEGQKLNFEFIQEVQVKTGSYSAEYGRAVGGMVSVITKSGGNEFQGDVFGYYDDIQNSLSGAAATGPLSRSSHIKEFTQSDIGVDLGGYLVKDKLWFFTAYNQVDNSEVVRAVDNFGTVIPGAPVTGDTFTRDIERDLWAAKITWAINSSHSFYASAFGDPSTTSGPLPGVSLAATPLHINGIVDTGATDFAANYDGVLSDNFIVNARFSRHKEKSEQSGAGANTPGYIDNTDPLGDGTTVWGFINDDGTFLEAGFGFYQAQDLERENINADATYFVDDFGGSHEFKVGYELEDITGVQSNFNGGTGQRIYRFDCSDRFDDAGNQTRNCQGQPYYYRHRFFTGDNTLDPQALTQANVQHPLSVGIKTENDAMYFQDTWRPTSNLTINAGVRWETQQLFNALGGVQADIDDNIAPRVGFTWDPTKSGRAKIFAHYGLYYETIPMDIVIRSFGNEISIFSYNLSNSPADVANDPTVRSARFLGGISRVDEATSGEYLDELVLGGEWEVKRSWSVGVKYIQRDLKDVIEDALAADGDYFIGNPGQGLMGGTYDLGYAFGYNETLHSLDKPSREYQALEFTASKRLTKNFQFLASALWSELEGDYDGSFQLSTGQLDPNLNSAFDYYDFSVNNEGSLSNDREWQLKFDGVYQWDSGLVTSLSAFYRTGTPVTAMGYSEGYSNWEYYLSRRGAFGRVDDQYEADLHVGYPLKLGDKFEVNLLLDIFNLLDAQTEILRENRYTGAQEDYGVIDWETGEEFAPITPGDSARPPTSTSFGTPRAWTNPRRIRFGVRLTF